jgi:hypothetical protein
MTRIDPDPRIELAWAVAHRHAPAPGTAFYPPRRDGPTSPRCLIQGVALWEPDLTAVYLYREDGTQIVHACPAAYWPTLLDNSPPPPGPGPDHDRVLADLQARAPVPGTRFIHHAGTPVIVLAGVLVDGPSPRAAVHYRETANFYAWVRPLEDWSAAVPTPDGGTVPRFRPAGPGE